MLGRWYSGRSDRASKEIHLDTNENRRRGHGDELHRGSYAADRVAHHPRRGAQTTRSATRPCHHPEGRAARTRTRRGRRQAQTGPEGTRRTRFVSSTRRLALSTARTIATLPAAVP